MLHEILLSLWGCSTSLERIVENESTDFDKYLHPGEKILVKKILQIVSEFNNIATFIKKYTCLSKDDGNDDSKASTRESESLARTGLYLRALCDGMDYSLATFREEIVELENIVLKDAYTPLTLILCRIEKYLSLFSVLNSIIREIECFHLHGCMLLECLHRYKHSGIPEIKTAIEKINHCVQAVFYKHLTSWLLYGHLEDVYKEFFIQETRINDSDNTSGDNSGVYTKAASKIKSKNDMWDFRVQIDAVPSYISPSLASKILTIGQTVIMFGNDPRSVKNDVAVKSNMKNPIWGEREYEYFQKLQSLQAKATFDTIDLERTVDELKSCVTELLWRVAVEEAQLFQQLRSIKDFYLLGRGDLYLEFIKLTSHILNKAPTSHTSRDVNLAFQMAMRKTNLNEEAAADSFLFSVPVNEKQTTQDGHVEQSGSDTITSGSKNSQNEHKDPIEQRGWGLIILNYKIVWPLQLLFSPGAFNDYNILFRFLLRVKKTQIDLSRLWTDQMRLKNVEIGVTQLRNNLIFIIDNLQYYLQVDVLESQYTIMENSIKNTRNFEHVQKAHSIFLANVMSQTFLSGGKTDRKNSVNKLIALVLRLCDDFILQASIWEITSLLASEKEELKTLTDTLDGLMDWLIKTLNTVRAQPSGEHLAQLLLRLDFNRWFSTKV
ncbi:gamma-tubulin complex component 4 isoform X2 [Venturia canescens]|uniref:gamma-tubulin complex component 4 isoform X2 n=1 Tax=Venturia canescens TaxID=32260 RepID=UPI001C9D17F6|nr:gamma-tubulin complex component 4 isoform X2 [Venturia canescens]